MLQLHNRIQSCEILFPIAHVLHSYVPNTAHDNPDEEPGSLVNILTVEESMLTIFGSSIYPATSPFAHSVANATYLPPVKDIFREILIVVVNPDFLPHCCHFPTAIHTVGADHAWLAIVLARKLIYVVE